MKIEFVCAHCGNVGTRERGQLNRLAREGRKPFCSHTCATDARKVAVKAPGWHEMRFTAREGAVHVACAECGCDMWLPPSKTEMYKRCGPACNAAWRSRTKKVVVIRGEKVSRERPCETCGNLFTPRPNQIRLGHGRYCSQKCNKAFHVAGQAPDVWERRKATMRAMREAGEWTFYKGEENPCWKGGKEAAKRRLQESGILAARVRDYRRRNPDKVREFTARRKERKVGRLPRGTIPRIRELQKNRCAICRASLRKGDHLDHIVPLARGGTHSPGNLQLLCPPCNLAKSNRDPIVHMQSLGRLL